MYCSREEIGSFDRLIAKGQRTQNKELASDYRVVQRQMKREPVTEQERMVARIQGQRAPSEEQIRAQAEVELKREEAVAAKRIREEEIEQGLKHSRGRRR